MNEDNRKFWERFARLYAPIMEQSSKQLYDQIGARIAGRLKSDMDVLELACGSGQLSFRLASKVRRWEATDFSEKMILEARKRKGPASLQFSVQDATDLPHRDTSFDAVVISNALHIMPSPEKALLEIRRVLKPGGILFAPTFVNGTGIGFRIRAAIFSLVGFKVYTKWSSNELEAYIGTQGFIVTQAEHLGKSMMPLCYLVGRKPEQRA